MVQWVACSSAVQRGNSTAGPDKSSGRGKLPVKTATLWPTNYSLLCGRLQAFETSTWVSIQDVVLNKLRPSTQPSQPLPELSHFYHNTQEKHILLMSLWFLLVCHALTQNDAESPVSIFLPTSQKRSKTRVITKSLYIKTWFVSLNKFECLKDVETFQAPKHGSWCLPQICQQLQFWMPFRTLLYHHWETKHTTLLQSMSNKVPSSEVTKMNSTIFSRFLRVLLRRFCNHSAGKTKAKHMENGLIFHVTILIQILTMFSVQSKYSKKTKSISLLGFVISNKTCKTWNVQIRCQPSRLRSSSKMKTKFTSSNAEKDQWKDQWIHLTTDVKFSHYLLNTSKGDGEHRLFEVAIVSLLLPPGGWLRAADISGVFASFGCMCLLARKPDSTFPVLRRRASSTETAFSFSVQRLHGFRQVVQHVQRMLQLGLID